MKRLILSTIILLSLSAWGQDKHFERTQLLPHAWEDTRMRSAATYLVDSASGERMLMSTLRYDQHGYFVNDGDTLTYDGQGRLIKATCLLENEQEEPVNITYTYTYNEQGLIEHATSTNHGDEPFTRYADLVDAQYHPKYGLTRLAYLIRFSDSDFTDTLITEREFNNEGKVVREELQCPNFSYSSYLIEYFYDKKGRKVRSIAYIDEREDTIDFAYRGKEVIMSSTLYWFGELYVTTTRMTLDEVPIEETQQRYFGGQVTDTPDYTVCRRFDKRGNEVYRKTTARDTEPDVMVTEIEYWDE